MRITVSKKIVLALAIILLTGTLSMLIIYRGLSILRQAMHELADIREPISAAAYEMEINVNGIGLGVLKYLDNAGPMYLALIQDDEKDFEHFHTRYLQLAQTQEERELGKRIALLYSELKRFGHKLMSIRDEQEALFKTVGEYFEKIDAIINNNIQPTLDLQQHDDRQKLARMTDLENNLAEVGFWLLRYQRSQDTKDKQLLLQNEQEFRDTLAQFKALHIAAKLTRCPFDITGHTA
jgi:hypothetical protein